VFDQGARNPGSQRKQQVEREPDPLRDVDGPLGQRLDQALVGDEVCHPRTRFVRGPRAGTELFALAPDQLRADGELLELRAFHGFMGAAHRGEHPDDRRHQTEPEACDEDFDQGGGRVVVDEQQRRNRERSEDVQGDLLALPGDAADLPRVEQVDVQSGLGEAPKAHGFRADAVDRGRRCNAAGDRQQADGDGLRIVENHTVHFE